MTGLNQLIEYHSEDGTRIKEYYLILIFIDIFIGIFVICFISFIFETLKYIKKLEVQAERTQKNINNFIDLTNKSIFNLNCNIEDLDSRFKESEKKVNLSFMLVEYGISSSQDSYLYGVVNTFTNVYKYDTSLFAKMLAVHKSLLCGHGGANDVSTKIFNFLFFELSFDELDHILEKASTYLPYEERNFYKLACFIQPFTTHRASYLEDKTQTEKNIFLEKSYRIYISTDCSDLDKKRFFGDPRCGDWYLEAKNLLL